MTGTDVELAGPTGPATADVELSAYEAAWRLARRVADTDFVPPGLRANPNAVLAAILTGRELGLGPMASLQSINVLDGRVDLDAELKRALVARAGHAIDVHEHSDERCTLVGHRADSGTRVEVTWTLDDAVRAQLVRLDENGVPRSRSRQGRPLPWETYPRRMLMARATSELCGILFADVIAGLSREPVAVPDQGWIDASPGAREIPACEDDPDPLADPDDVDADAVMADAVAAGVIEDVEAWDADDPERPFT